MFTPCLHSSDARMGNALQKFSLVYMSVPSIYLDIQSLCHMETSTKCSRSHFTVCNGLVIVDLLQPILGYTAHICLVRFLFNSNNFPRHFLIFYETFASHAYALLFYCHSCVNGLKCNTCLGSLTVQIKRFSSFANFHSWLLCVH